jgi:hypothetical protein
MELILDRDQITPGQALNITVRGFDGCPSDAEPSQVCIEYHEGQLQIHVWDGSKQDPVTFVIPER